MPRLTSWGDSEHLAARGRDIATRTGMTGRAPRDMDGVYVDLSMTGLSQG